jgi:hypothetical protein
MSRSPSAEGQDGPLLRRGRAIRFPPRAQNQPSGRGLASGVRTWRGGRAPGRGQSAAITYAGCLRQPRMPKIAGPAAETGITAG